MRGGRTDWSGYSAVGMICRHLMHCNVELCPDQCLVSVRFLHRAIVDGYFILRIFPVSASSISLCCTCILLCGCVGVSVRHYCCGFRSMSLKLGYRTLNCIVHFFGPLFWFLFFFAWGLLKIFSKSFLLQLFCLLIPIWNSFVSVVIVLGFFLFDGMVQQTLRKLGRCQMTRLI